MSSVVPMVFALSEEKACRLISHEFISYQMNKTRDELIQTCKKLGIRGYSSKRKDELVKMIESRSNNTPTFIEVCAGAGGLSSGLIKAGFRPILLNDNNFDCCETLRRNHPNVEVVQTSMSDLDLTGKTCDILVGGVPCQAFSQAGKRKGLDDERGDLMIQFAEILESLRPKMFLIENVKGLLTHDKGETIKRIITRLTQASYKVTHACLDASKFNVPQKRERVFIIGVRSDLSLTFSFPEEAKERPVLRDVLISVPPSPCASYPERKKELFRLIPQGGCWVNLPLELQKEYLGKSFFSGGGKRGILHRLSMEKPCLTLLCTPSQKQTERCHPLEERPLSVRESARIQTFDDEYVFYGSMASVYKQIGNAVPVELARRVGLALREALGN